MTSWKNHEITNEDSLTPPLHSSTGCVTVSVQGPCHVQLESRTIIIYHDHQVRLRAVENQRVRAEWNDHSAVSKGISLSFSVFFYFHLLFFFFCLALPCTALLCPALLCLLPCPSMLCAALSYICSALSCPALRCPALPCLPCLDLRCPALSWPALPCPVPIAFHVTPQGASLSPTPFTPARFLLSVSPRLSSVFFFFSSL